MNNAIEVEDLTKYYDKFLAVDHINFTVKQGEIFGFLGPNGAGKTTTQRMLTTLLTPTEGRILIDGHDLSRDSYPAKRQIGLVEGLSLCSVASRLGSVPDMINRALRKPAEKGMIRVELYQIKILDKEGLKAVA